MITCSCPVCGRCQAFSLVQCRRLRSLRMLVQCRHCNKDSRIDEWLVRQLTGERVLS